MWFGVAYFFSRVTGLLTLSGYLVAHEGTQHFQRQKSIYALEAQWLMALDSKVTKINK